MITSVQQQAAGLQWLNYSVSNAEPWSGHGASPVCLNAIVRPQAAHRMRCWLQGCGLRSVHPAAVCLRCTRSVLQCVANVFLSPGPAVPQWGRHMTGCWTVVCSDR